MQILEKNQQFQKMNMVRILRQSVRLITNEISKKLVQYGHGSLSARHLNVFENLSTSNNNIISLANRAGISKQAMSKLVKEIAAEEYVQVVNDKRDFRVQNVELTQKGADFLEFLQTQIVEKCNELALPTDAKASLDRTMAKIMENLESKSEQKGGVKKEDFEVFAS